MSENVALPDKVNIEKKESAIMKEENTNYNNKVQQRSQIHDEPLKVYGNLLGLRKSVSTTRLNRINAASRLLQTERFLQGINIYYSCFSAILAILSLISDRKELAVWSTVVAIILAISIVYLNAQKYGNRSQELKNNYIELHKLLFEIDAAIAKNDEENVEELTGKYCKLLQTSENHINYDYLKQKKKNDRQEALKYHEKKKSREEEETKNVVAQQDEKNASEFSTKQKEKPLTPPEKQMTLAENVQYYTHIFWYYLLITLAVISPILLCIRLLYLGVFSGLI